LTGTATDAAGLSATVTKSFNIDATAPIVQITAPTESYVPGATTTITGMVTDPVAGVLSLMFGTRKLRLGAGGSFTSGPLTLADGLNTFTLVATDRAGNVRTHAVSVWHGCTNL